MNSAILYDQLHYTERHIEAGESIEKQRQAIVRREATGGDPNGVALMRGLLARMERSHALNVAEWNRICGLLD
jgi:hypothetical protein